MLLVDNDGVIKVEPENKDAFPFKEFDKVYGESITPTPLAAPGSLDFARALISDWLKREVPDFNLDSLSDLQETDLGIEHLDELI